MLFLILKIKITKIIMRDLFIMKKIIIRRKKKIISIYISIIILIISGSLLNINQIRRARIRFE